MALAVLSILLGGCLGCGGPAGIVDVEVVEDHIEARAGEWGVDAPEITDRYRSDDAGASWALIDDPIDRPVTEVAAREWCDPEGVCYRIERSLASGPAVVTVGDDAVWWAPPPGRAEFVARVREGGSGPCHGPREGPMTIDDVTGGVIGGERVVVAAAGKDGIVVGRGGGDPVRVAVGPHAPRPFTAFNRGLAGPMAVVALIAGVALVAFAARSRTTQATEGREHGIGLAVAGTVLVTAVALLVAGLGFMLMLTGQGLFWYVTAVAWLAGVFILGGARGRRWWWLVPVWSAPVLVGWLPLAGWSVGWPATLEAARALSVAGAVAAGAATVWWVRRRHPGPI